MHDDDDKYVFTLYQLNLLFGTELRYHFKAGHVTAGDENKIIK